MTLALRFPFASYSAGVGEAEAEAGLKGKLCGQSRDNLPRDEFKYVPAPFLLLGFSSRQAFQAESYGTGQAKA